MSLSRTLEERGRKREREKGEKERERERECMMITELHVH